MPIILEYMVFSDQCRLQLCGKVLKKEVVDFAVGKELLQRNLMTFEKIF
jgi:hypothetical protein